MKNNFCFLLLFCSLISFSQEETSRWLFGNEAAVEFTSNGIQNDSSNPIISTNGILTDEGCATISDGQGNLLFYTDGSAVYDSLGILMPNGNNLTGNFSSSQSAIIIPSNTVQGVYFIFTVGANGLGPLAYSRINMNLRGGYGDVVTGIKNIILLRKCAEKVTGMKKNNSNNTYITTFSQFNTSSTQSGTGPFNSLFTFEIIENGGVVYVNPTPVTQINNSNLNYFKSDIFESIGERGYMKFSPDGNYLALCNQNETTGTFLLNFNSSNGQFSGPVVQLDNQAAYGLEFSIDSRFLYHDISIDYGSNASSIRNIIQYDLAVASNILSSKQTIATIPTGSRGALQLAMDGEIYVSQYDDSYLGIINNSNTTTATYTRNFLDISPGIAKQGLPDMLPSLVLSNYNRTLTNNDMELVNVQIFPNPANKILNISSRNIFNKIDVFDLSGKRILNSNNINNSDLKLNVANLTSGVYILKVSTSASVVIKKFIIQ